MTIVSLAVRRQVRVEESLIETQVLLRDNGADDLADIVRSVAVMYVGRQPKRPSPAASIRLLKKAA